MARYNLRHHLCHALPRCANPDGWRDWCNYDTNANRNKPYDYVLARHSLANYQTNVVFATCSFPKGLVFDYCIYTPLTHVNPVVFGDSGQGQHLGALKDFLIPVSGSNAPVAPFITGQSQNQIVPVGSNAMSTVTATGTAPLTCQWRFNGTKISGALTNTYNLTDAQITNNGSYTVVITSHILKGRPIWPPLTGLA